MPSEWMCNPNMQQLTSFIQAKDFLETYIPYEKEKLFVADWGIARTKYFLELLDNPQEKVQTIHIAGTSGKGSTAYLLSLLLTNLGYKVCLSISPYILSLRERIQLDANWIEENMFVAYLRDILPALKEVEESRYGKPTYFEILTVLAFYTAYREGVSYHVMETGLGGLYDGTNVITNPAKIAVITRIGLDHTEILGNTLEAIAHHKAGIIHPGNTAIILSQKESINMVFLNKCKQVKAECFFIDKKDHIREEEITTAYTKFTYRDKNKKISGIKLGLLGEYQIENCMLALSVLSHLTKKKNLQFSAQKIKMILAKASFPGRFQQLTLANKSMILDGAHNPQKLSAFLESLTKIYPGEKFHFILACKKGKDIETMISLLIPYAQTVILTRFSINNEYMKHISEDTLYMNNLLQSKGFFNTTVISEIPDVLAYIKKIPDTHKIVVTGSLYLLSSVYPYIEKSSI